MRELIAGAPALGSGLTQPPEHRFEERELRDDESLQLRTGGHAEQQEAQNDQKSVQP